MKVKKNNLKKILIFVVAIWWVLEMKVHFSTVLFSNAKYFKKKKVNDLSYISIPCYCVKCNAFIST